MNASHPALVEAKVTDLKWVAKIIVKQKDGCCVDIVQLLGNHMKSRITALYPKNTSFLFEGFVGIDDYKKLTTNLIDAAKRCGTSIVVGQSRKEKGKFRLMTIHFHCVKYRLSRPSLKRDFCDMLVQQPCTLIQQSHDTSSVKRKSRSKSQKVCDLSDKLSGKDNIVRRKSSSVRPTQSDKQCPFNFSIMCNRYDEKWYLVHNSKDNTENECHYNHSPVHYKDTVIKNLHIPLEIKRFIKKCVKEQIVRPRIVSLVKEIYKETISLNTIITIIRNEENTDNSFFNQAYPVFEEAINSCSTNEQCNAIIKSMKELHFNHIKDKGTVDTNNIKTNTI